MFEIKRNLLNKKTILLFIIMALLNFTLFSLNQNENKEIGVIGEPLEKYIEEYHSYINSISERADEINSLLSSKSDSGFVKRNIDKTTNDYGKLSDTLLQSGENRGIILFSNFHLTDIIFVGILLVIIFGFIEENKKGLKYLIRSTINGRAGISVCRLISIFIGAAVVCLFLYGGNIIAIVIGYGDIGFSRSIQSLPEFIRCVRSISIGEYFLFSILIKYITGISVAVLFYLLISIFGTIISILGFSLMSLSMSLSYYLILPTDSLNIIKYINLFTLLKTDDFFKEYCNLNIFGFPFDMLSVGVIAVSVLLLILLVLVIMVNSFMYEKPSNVFIRSGINKILSLVSKKAPLLPLFLYEGEKILFKQKGIIFMIISFYLAFSAASEYRYFYSANRFELEWYDKYNGIINDELLTEINSEENKLNTELDTLRNDMIKQLSVNKEESTVIQSLERKINLLEIRIQALEKVKSEAESGLEFYNKTGKNIWLINPYIYKLIFIDDSKTEQMNNIYLIIGIIGMFAGIWAYENRSGMRSALRVTLRGRNITAIYKIIWVFLITSILSVSIHLIQFFQINSISPYNDLGAPIQSLEFMRSFPLFITISQYFVLIFIMKIIFGFAIGILVNLISLTQRDDVSVMGISAFCILIPYALYVLF